MVVHNTPYLILFSDILYSGFSFYFMIVLLLFIGIYIFKVLVNNKVKNTLFRLPAYWHSVEQKYANLV